jgi:hypothetical protein
MAKELPLVFVGSSSEKKEVALVVQDFLYNIADVHVWDKTDSFKQNESTLVCFGLPGNITLESLY